jgi:hypothetical protein
VVSALVRREPVLAAVGVAGLVVALLCLIAVAWRGSFIPQEGKMSDAVTFTFGVGVFTLTMAAILPLAGYSVAAERRWRRTYLSFAVYGLVLEPVQALRGLDPRFSDAGGLLDVITGIIFGVLALVATIAFLFLGARFFRAEVLHDRPLLRSALRYGSVAVTISFGVGILMSIVSGRVVGADGNLMAAHALGVHGIQAVPLVALGLLRAGSAVRRGTWLHAAGIGWLVACSAALFQALLGLRPLEISIPSVVMVAGLAVWGAAGARALWSMRRPDRNGSPAAA